MRFNFEIGCPVKARKYYKSGDGFVKHEKEEDLYVVGENHHSKGIQHTSDVRDVQAYSSTQTFIYGDENTEWEELEELIDMVGVYGNPHRVYLFNSGDGRVKAIQISPQRTVKDLGVVQDKFEALEDVETESMRDIRPDEDIEHFSAFYEPEVEA